MQALRSMFSALLKFFGLPEGDGLGFTLASLRAGGATWMFQTTRSHDTVRWRGRWASHRTVEIYIQEVAAQTVLPSLPAAVRSKLQRYQHALPQAICLLQQRLA
eukprot:569401-Amphidinium_carterae.1